jgi:thiamine biosynthesis lipoprotein ApbE
LKSHLQRHHPLLHTQHTLTHATLLHITCAVASPVQAAKKEHKKAALEELVATKDDQERMVSHLHVPVSAADELAAAEGLAPLSEAAEALIEKAAEHTEAEATAHA